MFKALRAALVVVALGLSTGWAAAQPFSPDELWKPPAYGGVDISRDGRYLATTVPTANGRLNLAVVDLETRKGTVVTSFSEYDVASFTWIGNENILFSVGQYNTPASEQTGGGLFVVDRDGKTARTLSDPIKALIDKGQRVYRRYEFLRALPGNDEEVLVEGNMRDADSDDIYRLNVKNARATLLTPDRPARAFSWVLDRERVPRVVLSSIKDTNTIIVHYRRNAEAPFEEIYRFDSTKPGVLFPLRFESDNQTLQVATNLNRSNVAVHRYDPNTRKLGDVVVENPRFDVGVNQRFQGAGGPSVDPVTDEVYGHTVVGERIEITRLTEAQKRMQRALDQALPNRVNTWRRVPGDLFLVRSFSDRAPATWYLYDDAKRTVEELFSSRPWLGRERLVEMRHFTLKTRDGLEIPSYYFLPANTKPGERLPTVVHIHGGPSVRADTWGDLGFGMREANFLASRGYAVILPNFRITPGLGDRNYYSGMGTIGRQMVDDHEDAAKWAIEQGIADPERICISGASYGGYATLMALARFPKTFKCGVSGLMVSDLPLQLTSTAGDFSRSPAVVQFWLNMIGVKSVSDIPAEVSPVNLADRIKQPLFVYAGGSDIRTPIEQTNRMVRALNRAGNPPKDIVIKAEESHGFAKVENNVDLYNRMLKFLDEQIGPGSKRP